MKNFTVTILKDETPLQTTVQAQSYDEAVQIVENFGTNVLIMMKRLLVPNVDTKILNQKKSI